MFIFDEVFSIYNCCFVILFVVCSVCEGGQIGYLNTTSRHHNEIKQKNETEEKPLNRVQQTFAPYSEYLEYDTNNGAVNINNSVDVLYPDPASLFDSSAGFDVVAPEEIGLPDNDLTDVDLKGRDSIDNIMYIYYGTNVNSKNGFGVQIVIIGCVLSLAAQFLTVIFLYLKNRRLKKLNGLFPVVFNMTTCICVSNLIFIIGVQSTRSPLRCEMTALILHYAHLVCSAWIFIYCYVISDHVVSDCVPNIRYNCLMAYGVPAVFVLFSYAVTPDSYECKNYCWMSVQKGMFLNYMLPVTLLIIVNTIFATFALKSVNQKIQNALTISIESFLDSKYGSSMSILQKNNFENDNQNTKSSINETRLLNVKEMTDLNLDEELIFEACEIKTEIHLKDKYLEDNSIQFPSSSDFDSEAYKRTLLDLEKPKTSDYRNPNIYVDIENAKYSVDNQNVFYDVDNIKSYEYETRKSSDLENVNIYDSVHNRDEHKNFDHKIDVDLTKQRYEHALNYEHPLNYDQVRHNEKIDIANLSIGEFSLQSSDFPDLSDFRKCIRFAVFLQPAFDVCWFLGVVGIENSGTTIMPVVFVVCYNVLNWIILSRTSVLCPLINPLVDDSDIQDGCNPNMAAGSDDIPLLLNTHTSTCGNAGSCMTYLGQSDAISTISN